MTTFMPSRVQPPDAEPVSARAGGHRAPLLDAAWPLALMTFWMPVAYFLGFSALTWIVPALAFGIPMVMRRSLRVPGMIVPFALFVAWIPISALALSGLNAMPVFVYRYLIWVSTLVVFLWLCNTSTRRVSTARIVDMLAALWIVLVGFGFLAIAFSHLAVPSPMQMVLPAGLRDNGFIYDLTVIRFAELQTFATGAVPRPAAPLPATNGWGSTLGLLLPVLHPLVAERALPGAPNGRLGDLRGRGGTDRRLDEPGPLAQHRRCPRVLRRTPDGAGRRATDARRGHARGRGADAGAVHSALCGGDRPARQHRREQRHARERVQGGVRRCSRVTAATATVRPRRRIPWPWRRPSGPTA